MASDDTMISMTCVLSALMASFQFRQRVTIRDHEAQDRTDFDRHDIQRRQRDNAQHGGHGDGRFLGTGQLDAAIEDQEIGGFFQFPQVFDSGLDQQNVTRTQLDFIQARGFSFLESSKRLKASSVNPYASAAWRCRYGHRSAASPA